MLRKTIWDNLSEETVEMSALDFLMKDILDVVDVKGSFFDGFAAKYGRKNIHGLLTEITKKYENPQRFLLFSEIFITFCNYAENYNVTSNNEMIFITSYINYIERVTYFLNKLNFDYKLNEDDQCILEFRG